MFSYYLPEKELHSLKQGNYSLYTMFMLCEYICKNDIYIDNDVLYIESKEYEPCRVKHFISKWIFLSVLQLSSEDQDALLQQTNNLNDLFDFIFEYNEGFIYELENKSPNDEFDKVENALVQELSA